MPTLADIHAAKAGLREARLTLDDARRARNEAELARARAEADVTAAIAALWQAEVNDAKARLNLPGWHLKRGTFSGLLSGWSVHVWRVGEDHVEWRRSWEGGGPAPRYRGALSGSASSIELAVESVRAALTLDR